jgi:hypothetical protein
MFARCPWAVAVVLSIGMISCSDVESVQAPTGSSGSAGAGGSTPIVVCQNDPRAETFSPGLIAQGKSGLFSISLDSISPNPVTKGDNEWTIHIVDSNGSAVDGATLTIKPFMPDHNHGSSIRPLATPSGNGAYQISRLNLFMPGIWQISVTVTSSTGTSDVGVFTFCVEG